MRTGLILLVLLLSTPATALVIEDPAGDAQVFLQGSGQPVPADRYAAVDTLGLEIEETRDELTFVLHVVDAAPADLVPLVETTTHAISWRFGTHTYTLLVTRQTDVETGVLASGAYARLERRADDESFSTTVERVDVEVDAEANTYTVPVPRSLLVDHAGAPALPGTMFSEVRVRSEGTFISFLNDFNEDLDNFGEPLGVDPPDVQTTVLDRMPDDGTGAYAVRLGGGEHHGIGLSASEPTRASNGEATTMLFTLHLRNDQAEAVPVHFATEGVPEGWDVWFPAEGATFESGAPRDVPALVRMPFVHQHGSRHEFTVRAEHAEDQSVYGETALGVVFTEVPQPSGHHARGWLHTRLTPEPLFLGNLTISDDVEGYWNAQEDHGDDAPLRPTRYFGDEFAPGWDLPLHPGLGMGLDFDIEGLGSLEFPVRTGAQPMTATQLQGRLLHVAADGNETVLADLADDATPVDLASDTTHTFTATLTPTAAADRVPYEPRAGLRLQVWLDRPAEAEQTASIIMGSDVLMLPGGVLDLPLLEYHDEVDDAFSDLRTLRMVTPMQDVRVNPGKTAVFAVNLTNAGATDQDLRIQVVGENVEWATVTPAKRLLAGGDSVQVLVVVAVPKEAVDGEQADLVLEAEGDGVRSLLRLVARVDTEAEHEDQSHLVPASPTKQSPGPLGVLVLALLAFVARRRVP